jgi:hypothetical protein
VRTAPWFLAPTTHEYLMLNFTNFFASSQVVNSNSVNLHKVHLWSQNRFSNSDGFYNFFFCCAKWKYIYEFTLSFV